MADDIHFGPLMPKGADVRGLKEQAAPKSVSCANSLVKCVCYAACLALLAGTVAAPVVASKCCRELLLGANCWVWIAMSIGTLCYFRFLSEPPEAIEDDYRPVNTAEEQTRTEDVRSMTVLATPPPVAPPVPKAEPEPEPQQPVPRREMCVQTDTPPEDPPPTPPRDFAQPQAAMNRSMSPILQRANRTWIQAKNSTLLDPKKLLPASSPVHRALRGRSAPAPDGSTLPEDVEEAPLPPASMQTEALQSAPPPVEDESLRAVKLVLDGQDGPLDAPASAAASDALSESERSAAREAPAAQAEPPAGEEQPAAAEGVRPATPTSSRTQESSSQAPSEVSRPSVEVEHAPLLSGAGSQARPAASSATRQLVVPPAESPAPSSEEPQPEAVASKRRCSWVHCCAVSLLVLGSAATAAGLLARYEPARAAQLERRAQPGVSVLRSELRVGMREGLHGLDVGLSSARTNVVKLGDKVGLKLGQTHYSEDMPPQWHTSDWSTCSEECGTGSERRMVYCINGLSTECEQFAPAPAASRPCAEHRGCKWHLGAWGRCGTSCGTGSMAREVTCANGAGCQGLSSKPPAEAPCTRADGCSWQTGAWGECDAACGRGQMHRDVACENGPLENCLQHGHRPNSSKPCESYSGCQWRPDEWTPCSNHCGNGVQMRNLSCANGDMAACNQQGEVPRLKRACHEVSGCEWNVGNWTPCSAICGAGTQTRNVSCMHGELSYCLENSVMPARQQVCHNYVGCKWTVGSWGNCIAECGTGYRRRSVTCANGGQDDCREGPVDAPEATKPCINVTGCRWAEGPWGPCSNVCGEGRQFRTVSCGNGREEDCEESMLPPDNRRTCHEMSGCAPLQAGPKCKCSPGDPGLVAAGVLNALGGWAVSFAILHEVVNRAAGAGGLRSGTAALLSPPAILIAQIGALAATSVLRSGVVVVSWDNQEAVLSSSQLTVGLVGLLLWALSACLGAAGWGAPKSVHCASAAVQLAFCGLVVLLASAPAAGSDMGGCVGRGCAVVRRLRGLP